jgi:hypothetical protein
MFAWYRKLNSLANKLPYGLDKVLHVVGGLIMTLCLLYLGLSFFVSLLIVNLVAGIKELTDKNSDLIDAAVWSVGWFIGVLIYGA